MRLRFLMPFLLLTLGLAAACGDDETTSGPGGGGAASCVDYSGVDVNACNGAPCSFANDVMPVFQGACAISSSCHLSGGTPSGEGLGLGPGNAMPATPMEVDAVYAAIVGAAAVRSSLNLVEPGDPSKSWLMAKIDYRDDKDSDSRPAFADCPALACQDSTAGSSDGCGESMPQIGPLLEEARASIIRAWIADGAQNN